MNIDIKNKIKKLRQELPNEVTLVAVSKFHPISSLQAAYDAGQIDFGESRAQELESKFPQMPKDVRWHFIGHLQTNKVKSIIPYVYLIHSVDSLKLLKVINSEASKAQLKVNVLLELHVAKEETKYGLTLDECLEILKHKEDFSNVNINGVMGMATNTDDEVEIKNEFKLIHAAYSEIKEKIFPQDESFSIISMGMSGDYQLAVDEGSTMVRIGTSIFGPREY